MAPDAADNATLDSFNIFTQVIDAIYYRYSDGRRQKIVIQFWKDCAGKTFNFLLYSQRSTRKHTFPSDFHPVWEH